MSVRWKAGKTLAAEVPGAYIQAEVLDVLVGKQMKVNTVPQRIERFTDELTKDGRCCKLPAKIENLANGCAYDDQDDVADDCGTSLGSSSSTYATRRRVFSQPGLSGKCFTMVGCLLPAPTIGAIFSATFGCRRTDRREGVLRCHRRRVKSGHARIY